MEFQLIKTRQNNKSVINDAIEDCGSKDNIYNISILSRSDLGKNNNLNVDLTQIVYDEPENPFKIGIVAKDYSDDSIATSILRVSIKNMMNHLIDMKNGDNLFMDSIYEGIGSLFIISRYEFKSIKELYEFAYSFKEIIMNYFDESNVETISTSTDNEPVDDSDYKPMNPVIRLIVTDIKEG